MKLIRTIATINAIIIINTIITLQLQSIQISNHYQYQEGAKQLKRR